jgi:ABC-type transport system involved in cytochrome c biogenesis permease subunit
MTPYFVLYQASFLFLLIALVLAGAYLAFPRAFLLKSGLAAASLAGLCHLLFFAASWLNQGKLPLVSNFESLSFMALATLLVFLAVEWRYRLGILGTFILPIPALFMLMGYRFRHLAPETPPVVLQNAYLAGHVAFSMLAYAFFTTAAGVAAAYLVQHRQLKAKHLGNLSYQLPALEELEKLSLQCVAAGLVLLSLGMLAGAAWSFSSLGRLLLLDPKVLLSLALWLLYGGYLTGRLSGSFRGRKPAVLLLVGFLVLFFGYYLANTYGGGHHF